MKSVQAWPDGIELPWNDQTHWPTDMESDDDAQCDA